MKLIRVFPEQPNHAVEFHINPLNHVFPEQPNHSVVEFYINPLKISHVMITHCKDEGFYQIWLNVDGDSYHVGNFDSKDAAMDALTDLLKECLNTLFADTSITPPTAQTLPL